jgi:hypothetical protein
MLMGDGMDSVQCNQRYDTLTAQVVDSVIMYLTADGKVANAHHYMQMRRVPDPVQSRVLNQTAVIRRKSLQLLQHTIRGMFEIELRSKF